MLIWLFGAAGIALIVIADFLVMCVRKPNSRQTVRYRQRKTGKGTIPSYAKLPSSPEMRHPQVYEGFEELFEALSGEDHKGLFVVAEYDEIPVIYKELDS